VPKGQNWLSLQNVSNVLGKNNYTNFALLKGFENENVRKGAYSFLKPVSAEQSFSLQSDLKFNLTGEIIDSCYPLSHRDEWFCIYASMNNSLAPGSQDGEWEVGIDYEYMTGDKITEIRAPDYNEEIWKKVLLSLRGFQSHFENESHLEQIKAWFKQHLPAIGRGVVDYAPEIFKTIGSFL